MKRHLLILLGFLFIGIGMTFGQSYKLDPSGTTKYLRSLPGPEKIDVTQGGNLRMYMRETTQQLGIQYNGSELSTKVWGYGQGTTVTFPGPTFVAKENVGVDIRWENKLPNEHLLPVDKSLHWANPKRGIATVTHLHGGHTESASDGLPEAWFTQNFRETGPFFVKRTYHYDNDQEAATLWYHDHALGITRLNVYAGLAGFYLLRDENELNLIDLGVLPSGPYEREIVIQDRMFKTNGDLFFPAFPGEPAYADFITGEGAVLPPDKFPGGGPTALAEFFGDFIIVNGVAWPYLNVEPRKYRFRLLNGSDSRFYVLSLNDGSPIIQIGTDNGLLELPVELDELVLAPGERADVVIDFSGMAQGTEILLTNRGPDEPFRGFNPDGSLNDGEGGQLAEADPATTGQIMKFRVNQALDPSVPNASVSTSTNLRPSIPTHTLGNEDNVRKLALFEGKDEYGRLQPMLGIIDENSSMNGSLTWSDPITENPSLNATEVWEIYNATEDAHPVHLHLVSFRIIDRQTFTATQGTKPQVQHNGAVGTGSVLTNVSKNGDISPPAANEAGWKDTFIAAPGTVTRVVATFDREGRYVWHCHILSHEDHEMMRPFFVGQQFGGGIPVAEVPAELNTTQLPAEAGQVRLYQNQPNPFGQVTQINFDLPEASNITLDVYQLNGQLVKRLVNGYYDAGSHQVSWDGRNDAGSTLADGLYLYQLRTGDEVLVKQLSIIR